ncbi:hypothetical protein [Pyrinomonas sp.]|uniref:hypothetical protein n=1 Tax=Pyrinomonas sp. TaxID=2080306 RepID=UPI00331B02A3
MSIANELSSEVAVAMIARSDSQSVRSVQDMTQILLAFHHALRTITAESRRRRRNEIARRQAMDGFGNSAAFSGH